MKLVKKTGSGTSATQGAGLLGQSIDRRTFLKPVFCRYISSS